MKKGFTLSELLLSLTIVGIISALTVPVLVNNIQNKMFAAKVKNFAAEIEDLAQNELIRHRTRDIFNTDFADPEKLLTDKHFAIVKSCSASTAQVDCWKSKATGKDKVTYNNLAKNGGQFAPCSDYSIILNNGIVVCLGYIDNYPRLVFDVNGTDKPNVFGRDAFAFFITSEGKAVDYSYIKNKSDSLETKMANCRTAHNYTSQWCFGALKDNNWEMNY